MKIKALVFTILLSFGSFCFAGPADPIINYNGPFTGTVNWIVPGGNDQLSGDIQFTFEGVQYTIDFLSPVASEECFSDHCDFFWGDGGTFTITGSNGLHFGGSFNDCELFDCIEHYYNPTEIDVESSYIGNGSNGEQEFGIFNLNLTQSSQNLNFYLHPRPSPVV